MAGLSTSPTTSTSAAFEPLPMLTTSPTSTPLLLARLRSASASPGPVG
jgi:hypothetical protein